MSQGLHLLLNIGVLELSPGLQVSPAQKNSCSTSLCLFRATAKPNPNNPPLSHPLNIPKPSLTVWASSNEIHASPHNPHPTPGPNNLLPRLGNAAVSGGGRSLPAQGLDAPGLAEEGKFQSLGCSLRAYGRQMFPC